jgi:hypothetical protein
MLSSMTSLRGPPAAALHSDSAGTYCVTLWPGVALVAAYGDPALHAGPAAPHVAAELARLRSMAERARVPTDLCLLVDCSSPSPLTPSPHAAVSLVHDGLRCGIPFPQIRANFLWPCLDNRRGLALTEALAGLATTPEHHTPV